MSMEFFIYWGLGTVSIFNTIILFWLGLTVLLNAERRTWGIWLAGTGLLLGGAFFLIHTATLDYSWDALFRGIATWWHSSWICVIALPFGWYVLMLWYGGFWEDSTTSLRRRQSPWLVATTLLGTVLVSLLMRANPLHLYTEVTHLAGSGLTVGGTPLLVLLYPIYLVLCIVLSLDALRHPAAAAHVMDDVARRRARPWLIASSLVQLIVSLLVVALLMVVIFGLLRPRGVINFNDLPSIITVCDFLIAALIAVAVVLLGKAVISYEIFTGKALPRHGFLRQWRQIVAVAAAYSLLVSLAWALPLRSVYPLLLTMLLTSVFFAIFSWRSYAEREQYMAQLRPFVASQRLYEQLLAGESAVSQESDHAIDAATPFRALCRDVLGTQLAYLVALGPLAPLVGTPQTYPDADMQPPSTGAIISHVPAPESMCIALDPAVYEGAVWAVPLWSERGLIGVLLLGEKVDGSLYTQEEMEIARASGERLIDMQASAALAQRLMALQRRRLAESQVLDRRARRTLHDDVLPCLHTAMLALSSAPTHTNGVEADSTKQNAATQETLAQLASVHHQISNLLHEMPTATMPAVARLGLIEALRQTVSEEFHSEFDAITWQIDPEAAQRAVEIPSLTAEVLFYAAREATRNAARYGRSTDTTRPLHLTITATWRDGLEIVIEDDGVGMGTRDKAVGSGHGLSLHTTMMAVIGGSLAIESTPGEFTRVVLSLPQAGSTHGGD